MYVRDSAGPRRLDLDQLIFRHLRIKPNLGALGGLKRTKKANGEKSMQKGTHSLSNEDPISRRGSNHPRVTCASPRSLCGGCEGSLCGGCEDPREEKLNGETRGRAAENDINEEVVGECADEDGMDDGTRTERTGCERQNDPVKTGEKGTYAGILDSASDQDLDEKMVRDIPYEDVDH